MGGGAAKKQTNQMIQQQYQDSRADSQKFNAIAQPQQQQAVNAANNIQGTEFGLLNKVGQNAGWVDPSMRDRYLASLGGSGGGADTSGYDPVNKLYSEFASPTGGVDAGPIRAAMGAMRSIAGTGGWTPEEKAAQNKDIAGFENMATTGGLDADAINRMRGGGVFQDFQKTGGYTPDQISDLRARANSTLPAFYDTVRQGQNRMASIQGGNPAASAAMAARLARDQSKGMREQTLDTENTLANNIRSGQQWGATSGASAEAALQGLRTGNMMQGLKGASDTRSGMLNSIAANQLRGSEGWTQGELGLGDMIQQGRMFGTKGLESTAGAKASASMAGRGDETRGLQWLANFEAGNTMDAAGGMNDLYTSTPGEVNMWNNTLLANRGMRSNEVGQSVQQNMANNPSWQETMGSIANAVGSVAGGVAGGMTGFGALGAAGKAAGGKKKPASSSRYDYGQGD